MKSSTGKIIFKVRAVRCAKEKGNIKFYKEGEKNVAEFGAKSKR